MARAKVKSRWPSGNLTFSEETAGNDNFIQFGLDGSGLDVKFMGATSSAYMLWDESADSLMLEGGAGIDVNSAALQAFKAEYNVTTQLGAWSHGIKVELTRAANIQPVTGGWYGGQFVLNAGSDGGYAVLNKPAYALAAIFKGSRTAASSAECNAARFETQSSGKVDDICYILANTGTTVEGSLLYLATHIAPGDSIACLNVQSSQTVGKAIRFTAGSGSTMTSLLYCDGAGTFTNFLETAASGDGGVTTGSDAMNKNPQGDTEDGYITIKVGSSSYEIPFYAAA